MATRLHRDLVVTPDIETQLMRNEIARDINEAFEVFRRPKLLRTWSRREFSYIILAEGVDLPREFDTPDWRVSHFRAAPQPSLPDALELLFDELRASGYTIGNARLLPSSLPLCGYDLKIRGHEPDISTIW